MKATTRKVSGFGGDVAFYQVLMAGFIVGYLRKGKNDRNTDCPWQPFTATCDGQIGLQFVASKDISPSGYAACYGRAGKVEALNMIEGRFNEIGSSYYAKED
jgi:hypothetical protein